MAYAVDEPPVSSFSAGFPLRESPQPSDMDWDGAAMDEQAEDRRAPLGNPEVLRRARAL